MSPVTWTRRWLFSAIAFATFGAQPALAVPDQESLDLIAKLEQLETLITDPANANATVATLVAAVGMATIAPPQNATGRPVALDLTAISARPVEAQRLNMRLALTPLTQAYGGDENGTVLAAQTQPDLDALVIRTGQVTLSDIRGLLAANGLQDVTGAGPLTLRVPLILLAGSTLTLGPQDVLQLSRSDGAFVMNFGHLQVQGATITSVGDPNPLARAFYPFVTTADGGTVHLQGAHVSGLGFGGTMKFSGFSVMRNILQTPDRPSWIEDSSFENLMTVSVSADTNIVLRGNQFRNMRGSALIVSRTQGANILGNLFSGTMPTNAIRLEDGSAHGIIAGNVVLGGDRAGIVVRNNSTDVTVAQNIVWDRQGGGITLLSSDCGLVRDNLVIDNRQKGIEVRFSQSAELIHNTVFSNESAGIWISNQPGGAETLLNGNIVSFNGSGIAGANTQAILMEGNDFSLQYQQMLSGDLALQTPLVAVNMRGEAPFVLMAGGLTEAASTSNDVCTDP